MAVSFQVQLVTPTGIVFDGAVASVVARNPLGEFGVLADHVNFVTSLVPCLLTIEQEDGARRTWVIAGGLAEVRDGAMIVLANAAETPETVDRSAAERDERSAEQKVGVMSMYESDYAAAAEELAMARARIRGASLEQPQH
jgi:F-type H+-transporting ATPase subunit epsilon